MNERIKSLLAQAHLDVMENLGDIDTNVVAERFAELLIDECITQCSKALVEHTGQPSVTHNYAVGLCQDNIKEHFGVKE